MTHFSLTATMPTTLCSKMSIALCHLSAHAPHSGKPDEVGSVPQDEMVAVAVE